jgi:formylglycine-generating enzyme required for sulfatase activity
MILIEKGEFLFGNNKTKKYLPPFEISKYPITNMEYKRFVDATDYPQPEGWKDGFYPPGKGNHPVVYVSWFDAMAYCRWLSQVSKAKNKYRLPTEFEWEKAARGTDGREFPWGKTFDKEKCNSSDSGIGGTSPVGIFHNGVSPYGIFDAAGNVWEWTDSSYDFWDRIKWKIPILKKDSVRVVRGGSWYYDVEYYFRCAFRDDDRPGIRIDVLGFRVVRSAQS